MLICTVVHCCTLDQQACCQYYISGQCSKSRNLNRVFSTTDIISNKLDQMNYTYGYGATKDLKQHSQWVSAFSVNKTEAYGGSEIRVSPARISLEACENTQRRVLGLEIDYRQ